MRKHTSLRITRVLLLALATCIATQAAVAQETRTYTYDDAHRLIRVVYSDGTVVDYSYDLAGNRLVESVVGPGGGTNTPPSIPANPSPPDGATAVSQEPTLSWTGGDPDAGDVVTYSLYLGPPGEELLLYSGRETTFSGARLAPRTTHQWWIVSRDARGAQTQGPTWSFTTQDGQPDPEFSATPTSGWAPLPVLFFDESTADDPITGWEWDFDGDGTIDSTQQHPNHVYHAGGVYTVSLTAIDSFGGRATQTKPAYISVSEDVDTDSVDDLTDNCVGVYNPMQSDVDADGTGDYCDPDADADGYGNDVDNCPRDPNPGQEDADGDGLGDACTLLHCVSSSTELQAALDAAIGNGVNDVIQIVQGTYGTDTLGDQEFRYLSSETYGVVLRGGYSSGCSSQVGDASSTILDGKAVSRVLRIESLTDAPWDIVQIETLTITGGRNFGNSGARFETDTAAVRLRDLTVTGNDAGGAAHGGLEIETSYGQLSIERSRIMDNLAATYAGAWVDNEHGETTLTNSVISGNVAAQYVAGFHVQTRTGQVTATNNTITLNTVESDWGHGGGLSLDLGEAATAEIHNSIAWGNAAATGADLYIVNPNGVPVTISHSDYADLSVTGPAAIETENLNSDPLLVDPALGDFHLGATSPCIDVGNAAAPELPSEDFEGDGRVLGAGPDMGADEFYVSGPTYTISGRVLESSVGLAGIEVQLSGAGTASRFTASDGSYSFPWLSPGSYTVTPVDVFYSFVPTHRDVSLVDQDVPDQDFDATPLDTDGDGVPDRDDNCPLVSNAGQGDSDGDGYGDACDLPGSISGVVTDEVSGLPIEGATLTATGPDTGETTSGADGGYTIPGLDNGDYNVNAAAPGYISEYYPDGVTVIPETDTPGIDFTLVPDSDGDGLGDNQDNCPGVYNPDQADYDGDGTGDECDDDLDADGVVNGSDNCPRLANADQADADADGYGDACTLTHCVANSVELQSALDQATYNGLNDVIQLVQGDYPLSGKGNSGFTYSSGEAYAIVLAGGYAAECASRIVDPTSTRLDGEGMDRVLLIHSTSEASFVRHRLEGLTIRRGNYSFGAGAELVLGAGDIWLDRVSLEDCSTSGARGGLGIETTRGSVSADRLIARDNSASQWAGIAFQSDSGSLTLTNSVIARNDATSDAGGLFAETGSGRLRLVNNTITDNTAGADFYRGGGAYLRIADSAGTVEVHNNILWGNIASIGADLYLDGGPMTSPAEISHNDIGDLSYDGVAPSLGANLAVDPLLEDPAGNDFHLTGASACIDAGTSTAPGLPAEDFEGDARVLSVEADIGADEFYVTGETHAISGTVREGATGLAGIEMRLTGDATASRYTDENGEYRFSWLAPGDYVVTPIDSGYTFDPTERSVTLLDADVTGQDFDATELDTDGDGVPDRIDNCPFDHNPGQDDGDVDGYGDVCDLPGSISGRAIDSVSGEGVGNALVSASGPSFNSVYADSEGYYTVPSLNNGLYTVRASGTGYIESEYPEQVPVEPDTDTPDIDIPMTRDTDGDGWGDPDDNCPNDPNYGQEDIDGDDTGDICDPDMDGDGIPNADDNCPRDINADQADADADGYGDACTLVHCVTTVQELQDRLTAAQSNGKNDVLQLEALTFNVSQNGNSTFTYLSAEPYGVALRGGYTTACADRGASPSGTVLDGENLARVLTIDASNAAGPLRHEIELLTITRGSNYYAAGVHVSAGDGNVRLADLAIEDNQSTGNRGGLSVDTTSGEVLGTRLTITGNSADAQAGLAVATTSGGVEFSNCVVASNSATNDAGGLYVTTTSGTLHFINNSVTGNGAGLSWQQGGGIYVLVYGAEGLVRIHNNVIRGNTASQNADLYVQTSLGGPPAEFSHNNISDYAFGGGEEPTPSLNIDVDPLFIDAAGGDYHLQHGSPCVDAGDASVAGLPDVDLDGEARVLGFTADMGADEFYVEGTTYSIGGFVREASEAVPGIEMRLTGDATLSRWSSASGEYRCSWLNPGTYLVTPTDARYEFDPIERWVTITTSDELGEHFEATLVDRDADGVLDTEDNCIDTPNPDQTNNDTDELGDACDCSPYNSNDPPGQLANTVRVDKNVSGEAVISWEVATNPTWFGTYRGERLADASFAYNHECMEKVFGSLRSVTDPDPGPARGIHYYLVSQIGCEESGVGTDSSGAARPIPSSCP